MTRPPLLSRRALLTGLWLAGSSALAWGQTRKGNDQGLGGTGISGGQDQGMGGTGIVGVIQRFGSIFVNGERVSYAPNVPVWIDGEAASVKALKIGQLARVLARRDAGGTLSTARIDVVSEVAGPIEAVRPGELTVLGQTVVSPGQESWRKVGTDVAVFGLRRSDGVIVASLVDPRTATASRISGLVVRDRSGLSIGGLRLAGVDQALVGRRVQAEGRVAQGMMQVARIRPDDLKEFARASRLLVEGYVLRVDNELRFGSGYVARDNSRFQPSGETRVVVDAVPDGAGGLRVEAVQAVSRFPGESVSGPQAPPRSQGPMQGPGGPNNPGGARGPGAPGGQGPAGPGRDGGMSPPGGSNPGGAPNPPGFGGSPGGPPPAGGGGFGGQGGFGGGGGGGGGGRR
ncbi:hypothetical protein SSBR45G_32560 [Bradyrhizobium sp. SSBR45G]|uniref:DUF5666 domain-containing protein n=1 Tax=unclassified Bradyrhizobium TaxID=2631580 RepID=UPI002342A992|nr:MULTISPECIES: DUF5666 domain-containing protein [unclassified Bradyrhizobium]GLH78347.1 hypothetical protein SSBR45G_32560 [Bradyrhizobium sp. SSBR45G]GLH86130.1 hypothetical protein SSBR45R_35900 [Bradyrhizobium sp. SSBR45R]